MLTDLKEARDLPVLKYREGNEIVQIRWLVGWFYGMSTLVELFNAEVSIFSKYGFS